MQPAFIRSIAIVGTVMAVAKCAAAPLDLGRAGDARVTFDDGQGLGGLEVAMNGARFRPLAGGAAMDADGKPDASIPLDIDASVADDAVALVITSPSDQASGIDPGLCEDLGEWRRLDLSRYAEPYGQRWWPKTTYSVEGDFWFTAHWVIEEGDGTRWDAPNQENHGTDPFPAALHVLYDPDTEGNRLRIHEVLELRFSRRLWDVVPRVKQGPSPYRDFLTRAVFVDLWGDAPASKVRHFLQTIKAISRGRMQYYTILQNWSVGGWDSLLPDSMWLPDYPPNPGVGTVEELRELCELGKTMGRFGFRTNYRILREASPSCKRGLAHFAVNAEGERLGYLRPADWMPIATRGDREIHACFGTNACFTDQMTSGAAPWSWHDWAADGGSRSMRRTLNAQKTLGRMMKEVHVGPLGSETLSDQHLLGEYVDTGDYGVMNGHNRLVSPEYKLRRLHTLSGFHGMGLMYRFYEMPPFDAFHSGTTTFGSDAAQLDDYRCMEVVYGDGGYVCHGFANWAHYLAECLLVGNLQRHYSGVPVDDVTYWHEGGWTTLEDFVKAGNVPSTLPWAPKTEAFARIRVEYENGLTVIANRREDRFSAEVAGGKTVVLPRAGWVAWKPDDSVLAFSAYWPGTDYRVDYLRDGELGIRYLDPRGREILGVSTITMWEGDRVVLTADPAHNTAAVDGRTIALDPPGPEPLTSIDFGFDNGTQGWRPIRGVHSVKTEDGKMVLKVIAPDCFLNAPPIRVSGDGIRTIEVRMRIEAESDQRGNLFFATEESPAITGEKLVGFPVHADGEFHTYRIVVGDHPRWNGQTITGLRFDPIRGTDQATVWIDYLRGVAE